MNQYIPDYAVPPGASLQEILEERGISQASFARTIGMTEADFDDLIVGNTPITKEISVVLERVLSVPSHFWLNLERNYRETLGRLEVKR